jgi:hypothetical protein
MILMLLVKYEEEGGRGGAGEPKLTTPLQGWNVFHVIKNQTLTYRMFLFFFVGLGFFKYDNAYNNA